LFVAPTPWIPNKAGTFYFDIFTGMNDNNEMGFTPFKGEHHDSIENERPAAKGPA
jgi:hypothetical protein